MDRDNQQQTVSDVEIGWLGGFLEGEGSICLQIHRRSAKEGRKTGTIRVTPKVIFTNTDRGMIDACVSILTRLGVGKYVCHSKPNNTKLCPKTSKEIHYVHISGMKRIKRLLDVLSPCLYGAKRSRCERLLLFVNRRLDQAECFDVGMNYKYDAEDVRLILDFIKNSQSKQYDHISRMLNEHTRDALHTKRAMMCSDLTRDGERV